MVMPLNLKDGIFIEWSFVRCNFDASASDASMPDLKNLEMASAASFFSANLAPPISTSMGLSRKAFTRTARPLLRNGNATGGAGDAGFELIQFVGRLVHSALMGLSSMTPVGAPLLQSYLLSRHRVARESRHLLLVGHGDVGSRIFKVSTTDVPTQHLVSVTLFGRQPLDIYIAASRVFSTP